MCELAGVSRASFYRHWEQREPTVAETELRDAMQREGLVAGAKKVRRLMREDNLLAIRRRKFIATTDSNHSLRVWPNLAQYSREPHILVVTD